MRELRPFKLPQLVEARRKENEETAMDSPESAPTGHALHLSTSSTTSSTDGPSPTTPTFSLRGHSRFPSSTSSLASSPIMRESMDGFGPQKRLTKVKEEPQEREDDFEMVHSVADSRVDHGKPSQHVGWANHHQQRPPYQSNSRLT